jgi:hypothetical protein
MLKWGLVTAFAAVFSMNVLAGQGFPESLPEMDEYIDSIFLGEPINTLDQLLALDGVRKVHRGTYRRYLINDEERDYLDTFSMYALRADGLDIGLTVFEGSQPAIELSGIAITSPDWVLSNGIKVGDMIDDLAIPGHDIRGTRWACGNLHCVSFNTRMGAISKIHIQMRLGSAQKESDRKPGHAIQWLRQD